MLIRKLVAAEQILRRRIAIQVPVAIAAALLIMSSAFATDARYVEVVVDGIGDTPQAAMRNAAENGLKKVLGAYVDTETSLTRTTEETDGTVTRKKNYQEKYREYSRGVLKDIERISVEEENGIYRAVVKATIKVIE